jgi:cytochrome P450
MDKASIAIFSLAFLFLLHYILGGKKSNGGDKGVQVQLPPSPPAIPYLGHLHLVAKKPLHATLRRLAARYGPVFSLRLGARNAVVVSSAACARECFTEHDVNFANRPQFPSQLLVSYGGTSLIISNYGPRWRSLRRVATVQLLSAHRVACMSGVIAAEISAMTRRLYRAAAADRSGARIQLKRRLFELSLSVLMETIANTKGTRPVADADTDMSMESQEFKKVMDELITYIGPANMWDFLPVMRWFDVFGVRNKILAAVSRRDAFLRRLIDAERQRLEKSAGEGDKKSMIAVLLTLQKTEPELYTDTMITALCAVSSSLTKKIDFIFLSIPS